MPMKIPQSISNTPDIICESLSVKIKRITNNLLNDFNYTVYKINCLIEKKDKFNNSFDYLITDKMVQDLINEKWLTDIVIEAYLITIDFPLFTSVYLFPIEIGVKVFLNKQFGLLSKLSLTKYSQIVGVINTGFHFCCFHVKSTDEYDSATFTYIDPMGNDDAVELQMFESWK